MTLTIVLNCKLLNFFSKAIDIINFVKQTSELISKQTFDLETKRYKEICRKTSFMAT